MNDLYSQQNGFDAYKDDNDDELEYNKAKFIPQQKDLSEKFVMSKQYNSANFAPIRDKSKKTGTENENLKNKEAATKMPINEKANPNFPPESKLKTTPKITKVEQEEENKIEIKSKIAVMVEQEKQNLAKRFMQEIEAEKQQKTGQKNVQNYVQEPEREVVFNFTPKKETPVKSVMQEESSPIRVAGGYKIACAHCGKETIKKSKTAKYCSTVCRVASNKQAGINDDGKNTSFYLVKDDFDNAGVIEWANSESL
jgi:hypothetical protein